MIKLTENLVKRFGVDAQIKKALEESIELSHAIIKFWKLPSDKIKVELVDEIADIEIMIAQLKIIFELSEEVDKRKEFKINRVKKLLK